MSECLCGVCGRRGRVRGGGGQAYDRERQTRCDVPNALHSLMIFTSGWQYTRRPAEMRISCVTSVSSANLTVNVTHVLPLRLPF